MQHIIGIGKSKALTFSLKYVSMHPHEPWGLHVQSIGKGEAMLAPVIQRLWRYVQINTRSVQRVKGVEPIHPSCPNQLLLAGELKAELGEMGVSLGQIRNLDDGSFLVHFPATEGSKRAPHVVCAAHLDTYFGCPGGANPIIHEYAGGDIVLPNNDVVIPASYLMGLEGKRIITADGTTLLGGDDKDGVAALMTLIQKIIERGHGHGPFTVWFCTDEEIGEVGFQFLPEGLANTWDIFWTIDGEALDTIHTGCFYGGEVNVEFIGHDAHPGVEGHNLKPAHHAACRFISNIAEGPSPCTSKGDESFIYVPELKEATAGKTIVKCIPRTFNPNEFEGMREYIGQLAQESADRYGVKVVVSPLTVTYVSTEVAIEANRHLTFPGHEALRKFGIRPKLERVRAGTDGAMLNKAYPNIPAPNFGTGARHLHGVHEFVVADELELIPDILFDMLKRYALMAR